MVTPPIATTRSRASDGSCGSSTLPYTASTGAIADVARVQDQLHAGEHRRDLRTHEAVRVGDDAHHVYFTAHVGSAVHAALLRDVRFHVHGVSLRVSTAADRAVPHPGA